MYNALYDDVHSCVLSAVTMKMMMMTNELVYPSLDYVRQ